MSIIVYGPQGCGKSLNGEALCRHFKCDRVVEAEEFPDTWGGSLYAPNNTRRLTDANWLFLTSEPPPVAWELSHLAIPFAAAMRMAGLQPNRVTP